MAKTATTTTKKKAVTKKRTTKKAPAKPATADKGKAPIAPPPPPVPRKKRAAKAAPAQVPNRIWVTTSLETKERFQKLADKNGTSLGKMTEWLASIGYDYMMREAEKS